MSALGLAPWHEVVKLRKELKTGELTLSQFAADLYDVAMQTERRRLYEDPAEFFGLTYPTYNLRQLAKDVVLRLAGRTDRAIRQLELTYGGGKTHALITLYHLVNDPEHLPSVPAVHEFISAIGFAPPRARVAVLAFDKLDVEKGMEVRAPDGERRWLRHPWSVLAFQLAGTEGLRLLHPAGLETERESAPAENLLVELFELPLKEGLATLILMDEVLIYAREKVGLDAAWRDRLINFFQYLTQAATKVDRCAVVASLLATDPRKSDDLGRALIQDLYTIFRREAEEGVQPVAKDDVAEVLRRRFFEPQSIKDPQGFRPHVTAVLAGIADLDEQTRRDGKAAEERFLKSYPFHPDLTDVLYTKWTNLEGFQRTRGVLRTFALALRDAEHWDRNPLVGANVFLGEPGKGDLSEAARELTVVAATEDYEGKRHDWTAILEGELDKARQIQQESTALQGREVEQAVFATFLHSQPLGQKAQTRELLIVVGQSRPDRIELEKAFHRWAELSWFLDESALTEAEVRSDGSRALPKTWRLGTRPNLTQMHHVAREQVPEPAIGIRLDSEIAKLRSLTAGAREAGAAVHNLPDHPRRIEDDGEFHFAVMTPKASSDVGKPSAEAQRFITEKTGPDAPRVYRNALVLAAPSRDGLEAARRAVGDYLAWEEVKTLPEIQQVDEARREMLEAQLKKSLANIPEAIRQAYAVVVTVNEKNEIVAFKVAAGNEPLFATIKKDPRARIQETAVSAEALLPDGPYDLWREGDTHRFVKDLAGAFAQFPHLPKMLSRKAILDTLVKGCEEGLFVMQLARPDRSVRTFWREAPDEAALKEPGLEVVLTEAATLTELQPALLLPDNLPGLWVRPEIQMGGVYDYFVGGKVVRLQRDGYEEPVTIPKAAAEVVGEAIRSAVQSGKLWLTSGTVSVLGEEIPAGVLTPSAVLQSPPTPVSGWDLADSRLPAAWENGKSTALAISKALTAAAGKPLPWLAVRKAIDDAIRMRVLELLPDSARWPCEGYGDAQFVKLRMPEENRPEPTKHGGGFGENPAPYATVLTADAELPPGGIEELYDQLDEIKRAAAGADLKFRLHVELGGPERPPIDVVDRVNGLLRKISDDLVLQ